MGLPEKQWYLLVSAKVQTSHSYTTHYLLAA